jgi:Uma2 family endonuclease
MNVQLPMDLDRQAFLAWVQLREERYELASGRVIQVGPNTRGHGLLTVHLMSLLCGQLDEKFWTVLMRFGVHTGPSTLRSPDIVVDRAGGCGTDYAATEPVLLVEILSPSSASIDLGDKAAEYLQLPALAAYIVLSQDEPKAWVWRRSASGFSPGPDVVAGQDNSIPIPALSIDLPLSEIYRGMASD